MQDETEEEKDMSDIKAALAPCENVCRLLHKIRWMNSISFPAHLQSSSVNRNQAIASSNPSWVEEAYTLAIFGLLLIVIYYRYI